MGDSSEAGSSRGAGRRYDQSGRCDRFLRFQPAVTVLQAERRPEADVVVVAADRLSAELASFLRRGAQERDAPIVLVAEEITETELLTAVECKVMAVVPRQAATSERLTAAVRAAAAGNGALPSRLQGELLKHVERIQREVLAPMGLNTSGLTPREIDVLRLMADGMDTEEIAERLSYREIISPHYLLTALLREQLRGGRVVTTASAAHRTSGPVDPNDLTGDASGSASCALMRPARAPTSCSRLKLRAAGQTSCQRHSTPVWSVATSEPAGCSKQW